MQDEFKVIKQDTWTKVYQDIKLKCVIEIVRHPDNREMLVAMSMTYYMDRGDWVLYEFGEGDEADKRYDKVCKDVIDRTTKLIGNIKSGK